MTEVFDDANAPLRPPRVHEFVRFHRLLTKNAPEGYEPHYVVCLPGLKGPFRKLGSWENPRTPVTVERAIRWLKVGYNIGIAAMKHDPFINIDIDDEYLTDISEMKPTLMARTRSRTGIHAWYWSEEKLKNIPTKGAGEVRANNQYVLTPGCYAKTDPRNVPLDQKDDVGYYTIESENPVAYISFKEIPDVFKKTFEKAQRTRKQPMERKWTPPVKTSAKRSAVFSVGGREIALNNGGSLNPGDRWSSPFHYSKTEQDTSYLPDKDLIQDWKFGVTLTGLQALAVLSGYMPTKRAGKANHNSMHGPSETIGDDGAIFHAWKYAKENGYIPRNDPVPKRAMRHVVVKHGLCKEDDINGSWLPREVYNNVLRIIREEY